MHQYDDDEVAAYKGETGRNAYSRGIEHLEYLEANDEDKSVLWLHSIHHHQRRPDVKYSNFRKYALPSFLP